MAPLLFSGNSLQQAILAAARHFALDADDVAYRVREQRQGVVRGRQRIVIEVDPRAPKAPARQAAPTTPQTAATAAPRAAPGPREQAPKSAPERSSATRSSPPGESEPRRRIDRRTAATLPPAVGAEAEAIQTALQHLRALSGLDLEARVLQAPEGLFVDLGGEARARLLAEDAALLQAVEQLLPRAVRGLYGAPVAVTVDSEGVREQLIDDLRRLALDAAARVAATGAPETLREMTPAERRIVHLTLAESAAVETESLGGGAIKRVQIRPR